jgi:hypothetical protein
MFNPFCFQHYLPLQKDNTWSFGCFVPPQNDPLGKTPFELTLTNFSVTDNHPVWTFHLGSTLETDNDSGSDYTLTLLDGVLYYTAISSGSEDNANTPTAFLHADLTPRTIDDLNDPVVKSSGSPVRYVAGTLADFIPLLPPYTDGNSVQHAVTAADFGPAFQDLKDCIAMETNTAAEGEELKWGVDMILARGIGPVYMSFSALQKAVIRGREWQ